jgi:hypothetical protein
MEVIKMTRFTVVVLSLILISFMFVGLSYAIDEGSILGMWLFDEGEGDTAKDSSANGNDGQINGAQWVDGKFGKALEFDGAESVDMGNLQFAGSVTITFWAKPSNVAAGRQNILCKAYGGEGCLTMEPDGNLSFYWGDCGGNCDPYVEVARPVGAFVDNEWIHVAEVRDVSIREYNMYKNGVVEATDTWVECGDHPCGDAVASDLPLLVGDGYAGKFIGIVDEVAIFNVVLSEDDINSIMLNGLENTITAVSPSGKLATTWGGIKQ